MDSSRFDRFIATFGARTGRRMLLQGAAALGAAVFGGALVRDVAEARTLCRKNGSKCKKKGRKCKAKFCLATPFTIEARWSNANSDHDTYLFVPAEKASNDPSPWVASPWCTAAWSNCENDVHPFICISQDATGPGDEITTVRRLLSGKYEVWMELANGSAQGDLEVIVRNANGRVIRSWSSPGNPEPQIDLGWHVFDINGATHSIASVDKRVNAEFPWNHTETTNACPVVP
jgi:hypothetical protein